MIRITLISPAKIDGKVRKADWSGDVSEDVRDDLEQLGAIALESIAAQPAPEMTPSVRAAEIASAVKAAVLQNPERKNQPTVVSVEEISGLKDIKAAEIKIAFEALNKE